MLTGMIVSSVWLLVYFVLTVLVILGSIIFMAKHEEKTAVVIGWSLMFIVLPYLGTVIYLIYFFLSRKQPKQQQHA